jgi:hypothetical protein
MVQYLRMGRLVLGKRSRFKGLPTTLKTEKRRSFTGASRKDTARMRGESCKDRSNTFSSASNKIKNRLKIAGNNISSNTSFVAVT